MPSHSAPSFQRGWPSLAAKPASTAASGEQVISSPVSSFFLPFPYSRVSLRSVSRCSISWVTRSSAPSRVSLPRSATV